MFANFNQDVAQSSNINIVTNELNKKKNEIVINSKTYYLNNSSSKFISVGMNLDDFSPLIQIGGQNGFKISLNEEDWKNLLKHQGVIVNYFYSFNDTLQPLKCDDITIYFEKLNQCPVIKIQKNNGNYVCLGSNTVDTLWEVQDIIDYRIEIIKKQEFSKYFSLFQLNLLNFSDGLLTHIYNILNYKNNTNSENVSTMMELLMLYPKTLEFKIKKNSSKRKYYEEISDF